MCSMCRLTSCRISTPVSSCLLPPDVAPKPARGLNPAFDIDGQPHLMLTQFIAAVPAKELRTPCSPWMHAATTLCARSTCS